MQVKRNLTFTLQVECTISQLKHQTKDTYSPAEQRVTFRSKSVSGSCIDFPFRFVIFSLRSNYHILWGGSEATSHDKL